ncbi:MAG: 4-hydroxy-tetrahydrodipicolinate synthase [Ruminococcus sp.]|nr:4-hydroxy-tetrahydrodipicolinate synthase [uncultured Ruminococcus sp.]MBQ1475392.1 4-hydroxy-tetrahydrodipicolinate synthase [Ruminococcus sp.]MBQ1898420.1 4-hydroxy-tetrahydrodipicolinate synthase [Ruminococcus sp.]MBQ4239057.1 4-hydroxy-tetrahydrodipicolinate synthase [Ruminococcus sp.]MBQ6413678.1 4-hydroxy-tetrahydrodipicolinate synthase [Ruminococcus sp.]
MSKHIFTGAGVALITPMHSDGSVNYEELARLLEFQVENGTDAIIACGTTGEAATLTVKEHCEVLSFVCERINGRIPVIAGTGSNDTSTAIELSKSAEASGADALLSVTPYYNKTSQTGLIRHFTTIADNIDLPLILYNVPSRTGCNIKPKTYAELCKHENIVATKEANGDISSVSQTRSLCGDKLDIYSGNDDQTVPFMSLGALGVISVFSNFCPKEMHEICELCLNNNFVEAAKLNFHYVELMDIMFSDVNPIPVKTAMNLIGFNAGECRLPLVPMSYSGYHDLKDCLAKYNLIGKYA